MDPHRWVQQSNDAARQLHDLIASARISGTKMARMLHTPPPATGLLPTEDAELVDSLTSSMTALNMGLSLGIYAEQGSALAAGILQGVLQHQAAFSIGSVLTWVQQRPELLAGKSSAASSRRSVALAVMWITGFKALKSLRGLAAAADSAAVTASVCKELEKSGFLQSLPACLKAVATLMQQQLPSTTPDWERLVQMLSISYNLISMWVPAAPDMLSVAPAVLGMLLPLIQALKQCGAAVTAAGGRSTSSHPRHCYCCDPLSALYQLQYALARLMYEFAAMAEQQRHSQVAGQLYGVVRDALTSEMLLQLLAAFAAALHQDHEAHARQQQQQQQQAPARQASRSAAQQRSGGASSSSTSSRASIDMQQAQDQNSFKQHRKQLRADLLPIPAFHQDMLHLLPGGQAFYAAAKASEALEEVSPAGRGSLPDWEVQQKRQLHTGCRENVLMLANLLGLSLQLSCSNEPGWDPVRSDAAVLSAAAVQLLLELQLLTAGAVQRQRQLRPGSSSSSSAGPDLEDEDCMYSCSMLLNMQIRAILQAGSSSLPSEVLQQAGLQLLQALAAPVQQVQLSSADESVKSRLTVLESACARPGNPAAAPGPAVPLTNVMYALRAAAAGYPKINLQEMHVSGVSAGHLPSLAAAHPEAYTAFIECCLRSSSLQAIDMLSATGLLTHAVDAITATDASLSNTAAAAGLASAASSLVKKAVHFTKAASSLQENVRAAGELWQHMQFEAAACFPAALPRITEQLLLQLADAVCSRAAQSGASSSTTSNERTANSSGGGSSASRPGSSSAVAAATATTISSSSSSSSSSSKANAAMLAVVVSRCLVQLADAMQAASPELLFESSDAMPNYHMAWLSADDVPTQAGTATSLRGVDGGLPARTRTRQAVQFFADTSCAPFGSLSDLTVQKQWHFWQLRVLKVFQRLYATLGCLGMMPAAAATAATAAAAPSAADVRGRGRDQAGSSSAAARSSNSGCSEAHVEFGYVLQLADSPTWAAEVAGFSSKWPNWSAAAADMFENQAYSMPVETAEQTGELFADALELCRTIVAAAPLPLLCNNLRCESMGRLSEVGAASMRCGGCRCRYCCAACQKMDWPLHKHACKRMAAMGQTCSQA